MYDFMTRIAMIGIEPIADKVTRNTMLFNDFLSGIARTRQVHITLVKHGPSVQDLQVPAAGQFATVNTPITARMQA
jgi:hypothetical protein